MTYALSMINCKTPETLIKHEIQNMADKALISDYTWRSLEMQKVAFPDMPHYLAPDELPSLLRQSQRSEQMNIHVMSLGVIAPTQKEFKDFLKQAWKLKATIRTLEGKVLAPGKGIAIAVAQWKEDRLHGAAKVGGRISADNRMKKSAEGAARIKDRWSMDSKTWPTKVLLKEADMSYNTAKTLLPPRPVAQYNYEGRSKRQLRAIELDEKPREKLDFCGVYVFQIDDDIFKIGSSRNSTNRLKQVSAYQKKKMKVVALFNMEIEKAMAVENEVHYRLRKYRCHEYNGREIFKTSLKAIQRAVKQAQKYLFEVPNEA